SSAVPRGQTNRTVVEFTIHQLSQPAAVWLDSVVATGENELEINASLARLCGLPDSREVVSAREIFADGEYVRLRDLLNSSHLAGDSSRYDLVIHLKSADGGSLICDLLVQPVHQRNKARALLFRPHTLFPSPAGLEQPALLSWVHLFHRAVFGDLSASLFHRLTQPATTLRGACEIIHEVQRRNPDAVSAEIQQPLDLLLQAGMAISGLVRSMRRFQSLGRPDRERISVRDLLQSSMELIRQHYTQNRIQLRCELPTQDLYLLADFSMLQFVVLTILETCAGDLAINYAPSRSGSITAGADADGTVRLVIVHSVSYQMADRIVSASRCLPLVNSGPGSCLIGLCLAMTEAMGGSLQLVRGTDAGVEVQMTFPGDDGTRV
ncbi:MAG: hypothetical protein KDA85_20610, partial [Planctomycetaceae bacterium]|nr:hypothetical protein [Planctomycetaceae bacterium]